jgi:hypothetical protein
MLLSTRIFGTLDANNLLGQNKRANDGFVGKNLQIRVLSWLKIKEAD